MDARDVIERLETLQPAPVMEAVVLVIQLHHDAPKAEELVELQPRLEAALTTLNDQAEHTKRLRRRCKSLKSMPASSAPPGF